MDREMLRTAAVNLRDAQELNGDAWFQRNTLGLQQMAAGVRDSAQHRGLVETAMLNVRDAQLQGGERQMLTIAPALTRRSRGL